MLQLILISLGFAGLAVVAWPSRWASAMSLKLLSRGLHLALLGWIAAAFALSIWPGQIGGWSLADLWRENSMASGTLESAPTPMAALLMTTGIVLLMLPILALLDFARWMSDAIRQEWKRRQTASSSRQKTAPPASPTVSRHELQVAMDAMSKAAGNGAASKPPRKQKLADLV